MSGLLVVDDDAQMREQLTRGLAGRDFSIAFASDGNGALDLLRERSIDAIVLEVELPTIDGISLIPIIRRITQVPILMLSGKHDLATRIAALGAGADDYVAKPFDCNELAARVNSALRRPLLRQVESIAYADLSLDIAAREVRRGNGHVATTVREFDFLLALARQPGRVFTRAQLIEIVWGTEREVQPGSVETLVSGLRLKIDRPPFLRLIQTIRGVGYALRSSRVG